VKDSDENRYLERETGNERNYRYHNVSKRRDRRPKIIRVVEEGVQLHEYGASKRVSIEIRDDGGNLSTKNY
jgi:hypothetical protein